MDEGRYKKGESEKKKDRFTFLGEIVLMQDVSQAEHERDEENAQECGIFTPVHQVCGHVKAEPCKQDGKPGGMGRIGFAFDDEIKGKWQKAEKDRSCNKHQFDDLLLEEICKRCQDVMKTEVVISAAQGSGEAASLIAFEQGFNEAVMFGGVEVGGQEQVVDECEAQDQTGD